MSIKDAKKQAKRKVKKKKHETFLFKTYNKYGKLQLKQELPLGAKYINDLFELDKRVNESTDDGNNI